MPITIPKRLQKKLHSDSTYEGYIHTLLNNTAALITEKADFFPEYTLHGWSHIQAVLNHADKLIPDVTLKALSGWDAAILITAVVIHDLGMFLNKAGVSKLLTGPRRTTKTDLLDKYNWKDEWDRYIREIRRYSEEKLLYHFGMSHAIEEPDLEKDKFSDLDLLIVGDFLRRHHPRIAHEIALGTMPGDTDVDVLQVGLDALGCKAFSEKDRKCIGILARSHGMPIRGTLRYIEQELGKLYQEKLSYLMTILRIADALDADQQRAPDTRRKLDGIRTPVSVKEWIWNQRITRTDLDWGKAPDSKYVEAKPHSTTEYVHLENWLNWVQQELDTSWAVLSEVCDTRKFRLSIHRVESNILEEGQREFYSKKFITKEARLNANPELLKLLVGPLYDNDPSCGVRELLQNAVDACNERAHLEGDGYRGEVQIRLDTQEKTLTVTDNGIGMDENVLLNYYLSAGASYRTSEAWFEQFATGRDSNIVRTGRFGVGVLATFLLGNRVEVTTRHIKDEWGYTFEFDLEPKALDIKRPETPPEVGTTITVTLKEEALERLQVDCEDEKTWLRWYWFKEPSVRYWINDEEYISGIDCVPQDELDALGWFKLSSAQFKQYLWRYDFGVGIFCNGFRIPNTPSFDAKKYGLSISLPMISAVDQNNQLCVDLQRKSVLVVPEKEKLVAEIYRYVIAELLLSEWKSTEQIGDNLRYGFFKTGKRHRYLISTKGFLMDCNACITQGRVSELYALYCNDNLEGDAIFGICNGMPDSGAITCHYNRALSLEKTPAKSFFNKYFPKERSVAELGYVVRPQRIEICRYMYTSELIKNVHSIIARGIDSHGRLIDDVLWWNLTDVGNSSRTPVVSKDVGIIAAVYSAVSSSEILSNSLFAQLLRDYLGDDPWIPYDMEERRKKFPKAFEELKYYIDRILADREKERGVR